MEYCNCKALILFSLLLSFVQHTTSLDTISSNQSINGNETLVSAAKAFEAGFFNVGNSTNQYFCIWFHGISPRTVVWVANRDSPIKNSTGVFKVIGGSPIILDGSGTTIWFSNASGIAENSVIQLLDTGNLVVKDGTNKENIFWESFDFPTDTLLPGMKLKSNLITGEYTSLTCWKSTEDPGSCQYSYHLDPHGFPQLVTTKESKFLYRAGPWTGRQFTGVTYKTLQKLFNYSFVLTEKEVTFGYEPVNKTTITRYMLIPTGFVSRLIWTESTQNWDVYFTGPNPYGDECEIYARCGPNSNCYIENSPICQCLKGFVPKYRAKWNSGNWTDGCIRRTNLSCNTGDRFTTYTGMKLPDTTFSWFDQTMNLEKCENLCLRNCSCTAYANSDVRDGGSGCVLWFDDIVDFRNIDGGEDVYVKLAASELDATSNHFNDKLKAALIGTAAFIVIIAILAVAKCVWRKKPMKTAELTPKKPDILKPIYARGEEEQDVILPLYDLSVIADATNQFSSSNKLGEGGFGSVYKGALANGREIAVKRLSRNSGQGPEEFRNEVVLIANLRHRNLVTLLGYCIDEDERLLIYEFVPNQSLDYFIFDHTRSNLLDLTKRFHIIEGIARGLLYLHQDSMLRIIHRDLKPSNILLDNDMNPKISDFGLARTFGGDQVEANTKRVMGTYGYMPPEYVVHGSFSVKTDVFSFGVIILEIISGKKIRDFCDQHHHLNLFEYAWRLWCEGRPLELMDESLGHSMTTAEVSRCIHVGLLCVQERPEDRPKMSSVVLMLSGEKPLPKPMQPAFYSDESAKCGQSSNSTNEISMSMLEAR